MHSNAKGPTQAERRRFEILTREIGCIACGSAGRWGTWADVDHALAGGIGSPRLGHAATAPLCPWHHRGVPPKGKTAAQAYRILGPSKALHRLEFHGRYGTDQDLQGLADHALELYERRIIGGGSRCDD